jgi:hypothetical protein
MNLKKKFEKLRKLFLFELKEKSWAVYIFEMKNASTHQGDWL